MTIQSDPVPSDPIHYPECWDIAAYPTRDSALAEIYSYFRCANVECRKVGDFQIISDLLDAIGESKKQSHRIDWGRIQRIEESARRTLAPTRETAPAFPPLPKPLFANIADGGFLSVSGYSGSQMHDYVLADREQRPAALSEAVTRRRVHTERVDPPVPTRAFDWMAYCPDDDGEGVTGRGPTEAEALRDYAEQVSVIDDCRCGACGRAAGKPHFDWCPEHGSKPFAPCFPPLAEPL